MKSTHGVEMEKVALLVVLLLRQIRRRRKVGRTQTWARERIVKSQQQGAYLNLLRELNVEDHEPFRQFHRLDRVLKLWRSHAIKAAAFQP